MQNSIWKLTALAGVIGLGFLIVLQMQGEIDQNQQAQSDVPALPGPASDDSDPLLDPGQLALSEPPLTDQWEPDAGEPAFDAAPPAAPDFLTADNREPARERFTEPPAFLSEPSSEPTLPDSAPLLAGTQDFGAEPAPLPTLNEPPAFQLMSSEELADPFESVDEPGATLPQPEPLLDLPEIPVAEPLPTLDLPDTAAPTGLFDSEPATTLPEPDLAAPLTELPETLPAVADEPLPTLDLPDEPLAPAPVSNLFDSLPATEELPADSPLPGLPKVADETYLVEPEPLLDAQPEPEPLPLSVAEPAALPAPATLVEEPTPEPEPVSEPQPVLSSSTGEVVTNLTGDAELPAEMPASAQQPQLTIEKVAPKEATLGKPMIYSIIVSNRGATNAAQVIVEDQVPKGCRLVGTIPQAELIGSKLLWRLGHLPAGAKQKILVKVIPVEEGQVGSIATVNFVAEVAARTDVRSTGDAAALSPAAGLSPPTPVQPAGGTKAQINLSVSGPDKAQVGDTVVLKFNIANDGQSPARDVALQDIIPVGFEHPAGKDLTYEVGYLDPGKSVDVELELVAVQPGTHTNQAVITAAGNVRTESKKKVEVTEARGLTLKVEASAVKPIGEPAMLRYVVTNESSQPVSGATLTTILPAKTHFVSATENGQFDKASRTLQWTLPAIAAGASATLAAQVTPLDFGIKTATATLAQAGRDDQSVQTAVEALGIAALKIDLDNVPPTAAAGEEFNIDVTVTNRGNGADRSVQLSLLLPAELEFVTARGPVKPGAPQADTAGKRVAFTAIPEIGEQASVDFQITLRARSAGRHKLRAQISSEQLAAPLASDAAIVVLDQAS